MIIDSELLQFGNTIGIQNLHLNEKGCIKFSFDNDRTLYIERFDETILFFILKSSTLAPLPYVVYEKALEACKQPKGPFELHAIAKSDSDIGFLTKVKDSDCDQPTIYRVFKWLLSLIEPFHSI